VKHRSARLAPLFDLRLAEDENVDRPAQIVQRTAQTDHLGVPIGHVGLDHEEVEIAPGARVTARVRAEQDQQTGEPAVSAKVCAARSMSVSMPVTLADGADAGQTCRGMIQPLAGPSMRPRLLVASKRV
jgi:hypothetical protein